MIPAMPDISTDTLRLPGVYAAPGGEMPSPTSAVLDLRAGNPNLDGVDEIVELIRDGSNGSGKAAWTRSSAERTPADSSMCQYVLYPILLLSQSYDRRRKPAPRPSSTSAISIGEGQAGAVHQLPAPLSLESSTNNSKNEDPIKALIPLLPIYHYADPAFGDRPPKVVYTQRAEEVDELVGALQGCAFRVTYVNVQEVLIPNPRLCRPLGFDLEWRVTLRKGQAPIESPIGLVQLADKDTILLIQTSFMKRSVSSPPYIRDK
jgi:hypothetical protein